MFPNRIGSNELFEQALSKRWQGVRVGIANTYARAVWESDSVLTTWTPDRRLAVGDVITHESGGTVQVETRLADLSKRALPAVSTTGGAARTLLQSGVTVEASADVRAVAGTARIALTGKRSFLFVGDRGRYSGFATLDGLRRQLVAWAVQGKWRSEWHLVTAVHQYAVGTVIVAESDAASAELCVEGAPSLATITAGGKVSVTSGRAATYTMDRCTPFYEALRVRRRVWSTRTQQVHRSPDDVADALEVVVTTLDDVDLDGTPSRTQMDEGRPPHRLR